MFSSGCPAVGFSMAAALARAPLSPILYLGACRFIKWSCPLDQHIRGICPQLASDPSVGRDFTWRGWWRRPRGWRHPGPRRLAILVWYLQTFIKRRLGILSSLPAWAFDGADFGRLLAHPTLHAESASLAGSRCNPWDASRQVPLPSAYPGGHPHDTSPRNWRSLMGQHGASAGSFPRRSSFASVEVLGIHIRLENRLSSRSAGYCRSSRDVPASGPNRLGAVLWPPAGARLLGT
jgi:hypothetical protein